MNIPDHLRYTPAHLWVDAQSDGTLRAGITDHAQETLGDIVFVDAPAVGSQLIASTPCGVIESVKTASDLHAPLSGSVLSINQAVIDAPELINEAPYDHWIFSFQPEDPAQLVGLLDAGAYRQLLND